MDTINKILNLIRVPINEASKNLAQIKTYHNRLLFIKQMHARASLIFDVRENDIQMNSEYISINNKMDKCAENFKQNIAYVLSYVTEMFFTQDSAENDYWVIPARNRLDKLIDYIKEGQNYTNISYVDIIPNIIRIEIALLQKHDNPLLTSLDTRIRRLKRIISNNENYDFVR